MVVTKKQLKEWKDMDRNELVDLTRRLAEKLEEIHAMWESAHDERNVLKDRLRKEGFKV